MADTKEEILARMLADIDDKYDKTVGSFFYDTQKPVAIENEKLYARIETIADRAFVRTATGDALKEKLREMAIEMKAATAASGSVTISGTAGDLVPAGTKVMSDKLFFTVTEGAVIGADGTAEVTAVCDTCGSEGNVPAGAVKAFPVSAGFTGVTNREAFAGGYDAETEEEAKERYYALTKKPPASGNKYHYEAWATEVSGVGAAKCIPKWNGPGTVKVLIINQDREEADETLINSVAEHIEEERPVGAEVTVTSAVPLKIRVDVTLVLQRGYTVSAAEEAVRRELNAYLKEIAFEQDYVSLARIGRRILGVEGIADYENLKINGGTANVAVAEDEVPVLGVVNIG